MLSKIQIVSVIGLALCVEMAQGATANVKLSDGTRTNAEAALQRGVKWLESQQAADGRLGPEQYPAITAMALCALKGSGVADKTVIAKAETYVRTFMAKGATGGVPQQNMEVCRNIMEPAKGKKAGNARQGWADFQAQQDREDSARAREFEFREIEYRKLYAKMAKEGGDTDRKMASLIVQAVVPPADVVSAKTVSDEKKTTEIRKKRRGYGSMTYSGMLALVHDSVSTDDPRVDAMTDWAERGWSLDSNPGLGRAGMYFFFQGMTKCLNAGGDDEIVPMQGGAAIRWRDEFLQKIAELQHVEMDKKSGYWVNGNSSYMENNPVLVTTYALLAMENALGIHE